MSIVFQISNKVARITLNRPESRNALNLAMCGALMKAANSISADP